MNSDRFVETLNDFIFFFLSRTLPQTDYFDEHVKEIIENEINRIPRPMLAHFVRNLGEPPESYIF